VEAAVGAEAGRLLFTVRDTGGGIARGEETLIFELFHTGRTGGTGLGLAVARRIVELHRGTIKAENHPGGGALFTLSLPPD
jgi:signal transduction histidine kinase